MRWSLIMISILLLTFPAPAKAAPANLVMDMHASSFAFSGKSSLNDFHGTAGKVSGRLVFPDSGPVATGEVQVTVLSLDTGNVMMNHHMFAMFEPKDFPRIGLVVAPLDLSKAREGTDSPVVVHGVLTMHGVSRDASIPAKVRFDHGRYVCRGSFPISLKDYNLRAPRFLFIRVADQVQVDFSAVFSPP